MSLENEDVHGHNPPTERSHESRKNLTISYTREFLLSLSELDVCKKLPSGFDRSLLSEFEDTSQDRFRPSGSLSSQRRNEYSSSPPTKGDINNYSRGIHGRWDSRSSGRSDRDSDSQSEWDSDSGRRYGNQSRRTWQNTEHDGLLGSGSFPRPSGYAAGASAPKVRPNDQYQLNRSNEPYHPPRPYKAAPHSRRETNDSYNDETFGSSDYTSEDRAEEERKRRASFELMRKEQHKAFQEKQKLNPEKRKDGFDITELLEDSKDDKTLRSNELDEPAIQPVSNNDSNKPSFTAPAPVSRPLVPPGFSSSVVDKNAGTKSLSQPHLSEIGIELQGGLLHTKESHFMSGELNKQDEKLTLKQLEDLSEQQLETPSVSDIVTNKAEKILNLSSDLDVSTKTIDADGQFGKTSKLSESLETLRSGEKLEINATDITGAKVMGDSGPAHSTSILDQLFGSALTLNVSNSSSFIEHHNAKADETGGPDAVQTSKFVQWFMEEEKKPDYDVTNNTSGRPNDLLSLIVGGEKGGSKAFDFKANDSTLPNFPIESSEVGDKHKTSNFVSGNVDNTEQIDNINKPEAASTVLTCEDLEQSILLDATENVSASPSSMQHWSGPVAKTKQQTDAVDDGASQHLMSLLQKGAGLMNSAASSNQGSGSLDKSQKAELANFSATHHNSKGEDVEDNLNSGKALTLETLFGTAFMKELKSVGVPASSQRNSVAPARTDVTESHVLPSPGIDDGLLASTVVVAPGISSHGSGILAANQRPQIMSDGIEEEHFLGFDPRNNVDSMQLQTESGSKLGSFDPTIEIQLPEEDSLLVGSGPLNLQNFMSSRNPAKPPEVPVDISGKLAALNSMFREERSIVGAQEGPPFPHGPYGTKEPDIQYHNLHIQSSSPQSHPSQMNHAGPMFHPLDTQPANISTRMKFMNPENIHHDTSNHQFPGSVLRPPFHHPSTGMTGFDPSIQNPMLQQMHMTGNFPPPQLLRGFPRSGPPLPNNHVTGYMQEPTPIHGFPFGQRQPNLGGMGIPPQGSDVGHGTSHPEALQRLIEMELRPNNKQIHPFASAGPSPGMYGHGHELDMGFGYR